MTEEQKLLDRYADQVAAFRKFCIEHGAKQTFGEIDFFDLSMGFFIALGVTESGPDADEEFGDAHRLSSICRYNFLYWEGQTL